MNLIIEIGIEKPSNPIKLETPKEKRNLTTATYSEVSFRSTFTNGGDISDKHELHSSLEEIFLKADKDT